MFKIGEEVYTPHHEGYQSGVSGIVLRKSKRGFVPVHPKRIDGWHPNEGLAVVVAQTENDVTIQKSDGTIIRTQAVHRVKPNIET